jgi:hypothetical protein
MPTLSLAANETTVFIHLDKTAITPELIRQVEIYLRNFLAPSRFNQQGIPYVSDEEQADIEAIFLMLTNEDKEIAESIFVEDHQ